MPIKKNLLIQFSLFVLIVISAYGCATVNTTAIKPQMEKFDVPPLDSVQTAELGDTIVKKGRLYEYKAIDLKNEVSAGDGIFMKKFTVPPQTLVAKQEDKKYTYYQGKDVTVYDALLGTNYTFGGLKISKEDEKAYIYGLSLSNRFSPKPEPDFDYTTVNAVDEPSCVQELIYNGRTGNQVKFLYREFYESVIRPAFNQEVQYDLEESKIVGFKGARIEIIEASNTLLEYRVLNNFPEQS